MKKPLDVTPVIHTFAGNNYRTTFHGFCCLSAADCWPDTKSDVVVHWNIVFYVPCQHSTTIWPTLWVVCTLTLSSQVLHQFQHTLRWWDSSASVTTLWLVVLLLVLWMWQLLWTSNRLDYIVLQGNDQGRSLFLCLPSRSKCICHLWSICGGLVTNWCKLGCDKIMSEKTGKWSILGCFQGILLLICCHFLQNGNMAAESGVKYNVSYSYTTWNYVQNTPLWNDTHSQLISLQVQVSAERTDWCQFMLPSHRMENGQHSLRVCIFTPMTGMQ